MKFRDAVAACLAGCAVFALAGCGPSDGKVEVTGKVTFNGKPVEQGTVQFVHSPTEADTVTVTNGAYATRMTAGSKKVVVHGFRKTGELLRDPTDVNSGYPVVENYIPPKFNETTELTVEVTAKGGTHDFNLTGEDLIEKKKKK
jgi:hypothetical protein